MILNKRISSHNFKAFLWHAGFLAFAQNFIDVDTIIPGMIVDAGGNAMHIGIMTAIMLGGSSFTQLFFAPYVSNKHYKKKYLLFGINSRVLSLLGLGILLLYSSSHSSNILWLIFTFITIFSVGGAFSNVSYADILGKSVLQEKRKVFLSTKQILAGIVVLSSVFIAKKVLIISEFPTNYAFMFFIGAAALLIASGGFWSIKEQIPSRLKISSLKEYGKLLKTEIVQNNQLKYFLAFINTQGIALSFLPFVILYAKDIFGTSGTDTGLFLLFKVIGIVTVSAMVLLGAKKIKYRFLLYGNVLLTITMATIAILLDNPATLKYLFLLGGIVYSLFSITMSGVLLEVSGKENRTLYAGFAGAGNILPAIFPLISGALIESIGYKYFFALFIVIVLSSLFFIFKMNCKK